jgi:hypothetical protein
MTAFTEVPTESKLAVDLQIFHSIRINGSCSKYLGLNIPIPIFHFFHYWLYVCVIALCARYQSWLFATFIYKFEHLSQCVGEIHKASNNAVRTELMQGYGSYRTMSVGQRNSTEILFKIKLGTICNESAFHVLKHFERGYCYGVYGIQFIDPVRKLIQLCLAICIALLINSYPSGRTYRKDRSYSLHPRCPFAFIQAKITADHPSCNASGDGDKNARYNFFPFPHALSFQKGIVA